MGIIPRTEDNIFPIPSGATVTRGYVYLNVSNKLRKNASGERLPDHDKVAIGVVASEPGEDWKVRRLMYANNTFHEMRKRIEGAEKSGTDPLDGSSEPSRYITEQGLEKIKKALQDAPNRGSDPHVPKLDCQ